MPNITTPKINNPQNFKSSNTLVTTRKPHYATKVNTAFNIVPGMHRPNANNMPNNIEQNDFIGPEFKARPLKHWRRQLVPTNPSSDNSTQKRMSRVYFMDTPGSTIYKTNDDTCRCLVTNAPIIQGIFPEVPGAVVITEIIMMVIIVPFPKLQTLIRIHRFKKVLKSIPKFITDTIHLKLPKNTMKTTFKMARRYKTTDKSTFLLSIQN